MAWNEPGGGGGKDPWGRRKSPGPPDLDQFFRNLADRLSNLFGGGGRRSSGSGGDQVNPLGLWLIVAVVPIIWLLTGFYVIQQGVRGVELRFGRKNDVTGPGLHWRLPWPIDRVEKVNVEQVSTLWIGRRDKGAGRDNGYMLTEDENIVVAEFSVQYKIKDANNYLFNVRDPALTVFQAMESATREVVGKNKLDFIMTEGQLEVAAKTQLLLQEILDRYKSGIQITQVKMQKAAPPDEVKSAFEDAIKAREDGERVKKEAQAYMNDIIPRARGAAARLLEEARAYKAKVSARAEGDASRFTSIVYQYNKAPTVTRDRMYYETMEQVLSNTTKIFIDQKAGNNLLYLPLDRLLSVGNNSGSPAGNVTPLPELETGGAQPRDRARDNSRDRGVR